MKRFPALDRATEISGTSRNLFLFSVLTCCALAVGCSSSSTAPSPAASASPQLVAYLTAPTNAPTLGPMQSPPPFGGTVGSSGFGTENLIFAIAGNVSLGNINSVYQVVVSPPPPSPNVASSFTLIPLPTAAPTPAASPPFSGPVTYVMAQGPQLNQLSNYSITLLACVNGAPCSSPIPIYSGTLQTGCTTQIIPTPAPSVALSSPANGATAVPDATKFLLFQAQSWPDFFGPITITLTSNSGSIAAGALVSPSPIPTAVASGTNAEVNLATALASATTYTVTASIPEQSLTPPCVAPFNQTVGTFTTQ